MTREMIHLIAESVFSQYSEHLGYLGIFLFFVTVDQLTPFPEEVTLLTIGYLASNHIFNPVIAGIVSVASFLAVDIVYFFLAKSGNKFIAKFMSGKKSPLREKYKDKLRSHFGPTLVVLCFIPRMRMFGPIFAGAMNLSFRKFLIFDFIGLSFFTSVYVALGMIFHRGLHSQMQKLDSYRHFIFIGSMVLLALFIIIFIRKSSAK